MRILISNDDGVNAPGIAALHQALADYADCVVIAPAEDKSGASSALTLDRPLHPMALANGFISLNGTPTDCVHLGLNGLLEQTPDMVVSGINLGANLGDDVLYSGTVAAALEGRFLARPAFAFQRMMFAANLPITAQQLLLLIGVLFSLLFFSALLAIGMTGWSLTLGVIFLLLVIAGGIAVVIPLAYVSMRAQSRRKQVEEQFPIALDVFVRALRSGHPIAAAIELLTEELSDPIGSEFGIVSDEIAYGADLTEALDAMAERWDNPDMRMFVVSLAVQRETGGNLAEILESLARVIRERAVMYMKVRALSAEGRLTGLMLTVLPVFTLIGMFLVNPSFYLETAVDPIFIIGFSLLILLFLAGVLWIRRLTDLKV